MKKSLLVLALIAAPLFAQTQAVQFTGNTAFGLPIPVAELRTGTTVPMTCAGASFFIDTDGTTGANLYICDGSTYNLYEGTGGVSASGLSYYGAFASLPAANTLTDGIAIISDGASAACTAGSGSTVCMLIDTGVAWAAYVPPTTAALAADPADCSAGEAAQGINADGTPEACLPVVDPDFSSLTEKASPVSADLLVINDSEDMGALKKVQIGNLPGGAGDSVNLDWDYSGLATGAGFGIKFPGSMLTEAKAYLVDGTTEAQADDAATANALLLAISTTELIRFGVYQFASDQSWTPGGAIYLSAGTSGGLTQTAPTTNGQFVVKVGMALTSDTLLWDPSGLVLELGAGGGGGGGSLSDGDKGDITVSSTGSVWTIDNGVVTYAKMQNVSATDKLLGRSTAGAGVVEEIACNSVCRSLLDDTTFAAMRASLDLEPGTDFYSISAADALLAAKLANLVEDTTPQLGGTLDANGNPITGLPYISFGTTNPADGGVARLENNTQICWEAATPGTDICFKVGTDGKFAFDAGATFGGAAAAGEVTEVAAPGAHGSAGMAYWYVDSTSHRLCVHANGASLYCTGLGDDTAYNAGTWNSATAAPTQNAVRDYFESLFPSGVVTPADNTVATAKLQNNSVTRDKVETELRTGTANFTLIAPATGDSGFAQMEFGQAVTITRVSCSTDTGTVDINLDERAEATPNTAGTETMSADLQCDNNNANTTTFANAGIAARVPLALIIAATASTPGVVRVHVEYTID